MRRAVDTLIGARLFTWLDDGAGSDCHAVLCGQGRIYCALCGSLLLLPMMALDQTAMPYYAARAELFVLFVSFMRQSSMLALSSVSANILRV